MATVIGQGLIQLGLHTLENEPIGICCLIRHEAIIIDIALITQSIPSIHFSPFDSIEEILVFTQPLVLFCDEHSINLICKAKKDRKNIVLEYLVPFEQIKEKNIELTRACGLKVVHMNEIIAASQNTIKIPRFSSFYSVVFSSGQQFY